MLDMWFKHGCRGVICCVGRNANDSLTWYSRWEALKPRADQYSFPSRAVQVREDSIALTKQRLARHMEENQDDDDAKQLQAQNSVRISETRINLATTGRLPRDVWLKDARGMDVADERKPTGIEDDARASAVRFATTARDNEHMLRLERLDEVPVVPGTNGVPHVASTIGEDSPDLPKLVRADSIAVTHRRLSRTESKETAEDDSTKVTRESAVRFAAMPRDNSTQLALDRCQTCSAHQK